MSSGSKALDTIVQRLGGTADPRRRYEYVLWLARKLAPLPEELRQDAYKVRGCVSQVYVVGSLVDGRLHWCGDSDAAITKGLLALLIEGLEGLTPAEAAAIDPAFIAATGLQASLTPSRANGFLNILRSMQSQARRLAGAAASAEAAAAEAPASAEAPAVAEADGSAEAANPADF